MVETHEFIGVITKDNEFKITSPIIPSTSKFAIIKEGDLYNGYKFYVTYYHEKVISSNDLNVVIMYLLTCQE